MKMGVWSKRIFVLALILGLVLASGPRATAADYPDKPVNLIIPYPAGGSTDVTGRALMNAVKKHFSQPVIVENKAGGGGTVGPNLVITKPPDGYTLGIMASATVTISWHMGKMNFNPIEDATHIIRYTGYLYGLVVRADSPWKTLKEFVEYAKANPGKIRYSTAGPGSPSHLGMEQFVRKAGIKCTHIPFEGTAPAIAAILGGHVEACADSVFWKPHVLSGKLRLLAGLDDKRIGFAPNVPTLIELGYDITPISLLGVVGPKGLPPQIVGILHDAYKKAMQDPDFVKVMNQMDMVFSYRSPQDFEKYILTLNEQLGPLFREIGIQKQ